MSLLHVARSLRAGSCATCSVLGVGAHALRRTTATVAALYRPTATRILHATQLRAPFSARTGSNPTSQSATDVSSSQQQQKKTSTEELPPTTAYTTREVGERGTLEWRMYFQVNGVDISPWHDIPLLGPGSTRQELRFHFVNEIPKGTRPKLELATKERLNPLKQDIKNNTLRNFTYGDLPFNYGCIPQTWENPHAPHILTNKNGDNDPIDVVELSAEPIAIGSVRAVKVLGVLGLLDEDETDWKVMVLDAENPWTKDVHSLADLEKHQPGVTQRVVQWFKLYKTTDGKKENAFAFDAEIRDTKLATRLIWETHAEWAALCKGEIKPLQLILNDQVPLAALGGHIKQEFEKEEQHPAVDVDTKA